MEVAPIIAYTMVPVLRTVHAILDMYFTEANAFLSIIAPPATEDVTTTAYMTDQVTHIAPAILALHLLESHVTRL